MLISLFMTGCSRIETTPEFQPLFKRCDFYVAVDSNGQTYYVDYADGILSVIGLGRTALEKYMCDAPKLLATKYESAKIIAAGKQETTDAEGIALGNLYITKTEIITFNFADLSIIDRQPLKKIGVTRIGNYDDFVDKLDLLWEAVSDRSEYLITIDINENPVLYKEDRIVYYDGGHVYLKNAVSLYEDPVSYAEFYDKFVQVQSRSELLRRSNGLNDYLCIVFKESICFISDSGHLIFSKEDS